MPSKPLQRNTAGLGLSIAPVVSTSAGAADAEKLVELDATGKLDSSFLPPTEDKTAPITVAAGVTLAAGDYVHIEDNGGTPELYLADNTQDRPAHGFVDAAAAPGSTIEVFKEGTNANVAGRTPGATQYLTTAGQTTETKPTIDAGTFSQAVGVAVTATEVDFEPSYYAIYGDGIVFTYDPTATITSGSVIGLGLSGSYCQMLCLEKVVQATVSV